MACRPAVRLTPPRSTLDSSLVYSLYASFLYKNEAHPLSSQPLPHSYTKTPGCHPLCTPTPSSITLSPCPARSIGVALFTDHGPRSTDHAPITPLSATLTKTPGVGVPQCEPATLRLTLEWLVPEFRASALLNASCFIISAPPATILRRRCPHPVDSSPREGRFPNEWSFACSPF